MEKIVLSQEDYFLHIFLCKSEIISMLKKESSMLESVKSGARSGCR